MAGGLPRRHTTYLAGIEYLDGQVQTIPLPDGRFAKTPGGAWRTEYHHKDHLGNLRIAFADLDGNGRITHNAVGQPQEVTQEEHYYPFGMAQAGMWYGAEAPGGRYKYNGKELVQELGLGWHDYGARGYDAALGRWGQVDPLAEKRNWVTGYNFVQNSPLNRVDPDGLTDFTIDSQGRIRKVEGTDTDSGPDRLIRGNATYNKKGELKGKEGKKYMEVEKGVLDNIKTDGEKYQIFVMPSGQASEKLYDFIASAINAEMGKYDVTRGDGTQESIFHTSFEWGRIAGNTEYLEGLKKEDPGLQLISMIHNHGNNPDPNSNAVGSYGPSGEPGGSRGDIPQAEYLNKVFKGQDRKARYYIWRFGTKTEYDEKGKKK